ncbi:hypothetical protein RJT34_12157 [Clitoria ternatea]|uniref:Uncharacterized protein n=1 Tax=Clitoria ternatea TaxID=43366 RepID=A0AAN9PK80_CLITE
MNHPSLSKTSLAFTLIHHQSLIVAHIHNITTSEGNGKVTVPRDKGGSESERESEREDDQRKKDGTMREMKAWTTVLGENVPPCFRCQGEKEKSETMGIRIGKRGR